MDIPLYTGQVFTIIKHLARKVGNLCKDKLQKAMNCYPMLTFHEDIHLYGEVSGSGNEGLLSVIAAAGIHNESISSFQSEGLSQLVQN